MTDPEPSGHSDGPDPAGTTLYRERIRLERPPELAARAVRRSLGIDEPGVDSKLGGRDDAPAEPGKPGVDESRAQSAASGTDAREKSAAPVPDAPGRSTRWETGTGDEFAWRVRRLAGLYSHEVRIDSATGTATYAIRSPAAFGVLAALVLLVPLLVGASAVTGTAIPREGVTVGLWACAALAVLPVAPLWPDTAASGPDLSELGETAERRLSPVAVPPYLAVVALAWLALSSGGRPLLAGVAALVLTGIGAGVYYAAGAVPSVKPGGVPAVGLALTALVPALVTAGNAVVAGVLIGEGTARGETALLVAVAFLAGMNAVFLLFCRAAEQRFREARIDHVGSRLGRVVGLAGLAVGNATLVAVPLAGGWALWMQRTSTPAGQLGALLPEYGAIASAMGWLPDPAIPVAVGGFYCHVSLPLLVTLTGWVHFLATRLTLGPLAVFGSRRIDAPDAVGDVEVRRADLGTPVARPVSFGSREFVLVDGTLVDRLSEPELAAVVAHEAYHLRRGGPAGSLLAAVASMAVGGHNALLAFYDYPAIERAADTHAAQRTGREAVVKALRSLEQLRYEHRPDPEPTDRPLGRARTLLSAPARLYFGPVLLDRAHRDVDERIELIAAGPE
jgi:Zn-dependent protease with chaperone function